MTERARDFLAIVALPIVLTVVICGSLLSWHVFSAWQESSTYNRLTGAHTTTWDAFWVELRVQDSPKSTDKL